MPGLEHRMVDAARKAGIVTASAALTLVGAGFVTSAAWIYLAAEHSAVLAGLVIGLVYLGAATLTLALGLGRNRRNRQRSRFPGGVTPAQLVMISFLQGLDQGRKVGRPS